MFPGQWIHASGNPVTLWLPWFPRGADNAIFTFEKEVTIGTGTFAVKVYSKDTEEIGDGKYESASSFNRVASTTFYTSGVFENLSELVRFQYSLDSEGTAAVLFRMLSPTWIVQAT